VAALVPCFSLNTAPATLGVPEIKTPTGGGAVALALQDKVAQA
jgi:hypothetical protein